MYQDDGPAFPVVQIGHAVSVDGRCMNGVSMEQVNAGGNAKRGSGCHNGRMARRRKRSILRAGTGARRFLFIRAGSGFHRN